MKSGWKTTEFWISLTTQVVAVIALLGLIPMTDVSMINGWINEAIVKVVSLVSLATVAWKYISDRTLLKLAHSEK